MQNQEGQVGKYDDRIISPHLNKYRKTNYKFCSTVENEDFHLKILYDNFIEIFCFRTDNSTIIKQLTLSK